MDWQAGLTVSEPELEAILKGLLRTAEDGVFLFLRVLLLHSLEKALKSIQLIHVPL
jgi:hypothetical protein